MATIKIKGNTSGEVALTVPAAAGTNTLTLPAGTGNILTDAAVTNNGIYLGGTASANLLDDYEEGTWTPNLFGAATAGTWTPDSLNAGFYIKVGRMVTLYGNCRGTLSGAAGDARINGLPFTRATGNADNGRNAAYTGMCISYWTPITADASGFLAHPSNFLYSHTRTDTSSSGGVVQVVNGVNNVHFSGSYYTD